MATARQIEANRRNAAGPHKMTEAGKQAVKGNAIRHGLATRVHVVLPGEDPDFFNEILDSLRTEYAPSTTQQELLVHQIAENYWRLVRARNMENGSLLQAESEFATQYSVESTPDDDLTRGALLGLAFSKNGKMFDKLSRYQAAAERSYYRAIRELQRIQKTQPQPQPQPRPNQNRDRQEAATSGTEPTPAATKPTPTPEFRSVPQNRPNPTQLDMEMAHIRMSEAEFASYLDEITAPPK